ncbi:MAG: UDP-N-acetylmuramoyl-L-alanyl-D-glutamate--2,6-diaminopimelate ligase [Solirubrobacterales bacterium]
MKLSDLISKAGVNAETAAGDPSIGGLSYDSRRVSEGDLFFCVPGRQSDGHLFASAAVEAGAAALVVERDLGLGVPQVQVTDARAAMAPLAAAFFGDPTAELAVAGVTGTNGKTTIAFLLRSILEASGRSCGLLGTVKQVVGGAEITGERTTPEAIDLQRTFRAMREAGDDACAMEVSSHALVLRRADAIHYDAKIFTNLTQEHLDFHTDMDDYFAAKRMLFEIEAGQAIVNVDDPYGRRLAAEVECLTFSAAGVSEAAYRAEGFNLSAGGATFRCATPAGEIEVSTSMPGHFNVSNAVAAIAGAHALGVEPADAARALAVAERVPGRFEPIEEGQRFAVYVDYAHTPDSLDNVLRAARRLTAGKLIAVFGCGGDRDREKRPLMGRIGAELADTALITSDNPRSEDPAAIIEAVVAGVDGDAEVVVEPDRGTAIAKGLAMAGPGDVVVIAGKGHEQGQEFESGRKIPFDDREVARQELRRLGEPAAI